MNQPRNMLASTVQKRLRLLAKPVMDEGFP
jgi:hypothetical protein